MNTKNKKNTGKKNSFYLRNPDRINDDMKYDLESGDNPDERKEIYKTKK